MSKIVYEKKFYGNAIEDLDPIDFLSSDDIEVDDFGDPKGTFTVTVKFEPDTNSSYEDD